MGDIRRISVSLSTIMGNYATEMVKAAIVTDALAESLDRLDKKSNAAFADVGRTAEGAATKIEKSSTKTKASIGAASKSVSDFDRLVRSNLQDQGTAYEAVGRSIDQYKMRIGGLKEEINRSGRSSLFGDLDKAKSDLGKLEGYAKDLGPAVAKDGESAGKNFVEKFGGALGGLRYMPSNPYVAAALGGLGIAMAPAILASLEGALGAGVGAAGLAAGIVASLHSPQVQGALTGLKYDAADIFSGIGKEFAGPVSAGIDDIDAMIKSVGPELQSTFSAIAPDAKILIDGVGGFIQNLLPGLEEGFRNAQPLVQELAKDLPQLGTDVGTMIDEFTQGGPGAVDALHDLITVVGDVAVGVGKVFEISAKTFRYMEFGVDLVNGHLGDMTGLLSETTSGTGSLTDAVDGFSESADHGSREVDQLNTAFTKWLTTAENADNATLALDRAQLTFNSNLKKGTKNWDENKKAGQAQVGNLNDLVQALTHKYDGMKVNGLLTADQTKAELTLAEGYYKTAKAAGASKDELATLKGIIDGLNAALGKTPPAKTIKFSAPGLGKAVTDARHLYDAVSALDGKSIHVGVSLSGANKNMFLGMSNRDGGVYTHAMSGALRDADVYSPVSSGARYAFAEPATGGEGFVPKYGNYARSTQIIDTEARWYGGRFVAGGAGGGGGSQSSYSPSLSFSVYPQRANWSVHDQMALQATAEAMMQVGRSW